jgi:hypothetical protein
MAETTPSKPKRTKKTDFLQEFLKKYEQITKLKSEMSKSRIQPTDLLTGIRSLSIECVYGTDWIRESWLSPKTYLGWAFSAQQLGTDMGDAAACTFAKRSLCRVLDGFIQHYHLTKFSGDNYPEKIEVLSQLGIPAGTTIHELVIDPRNIQEHRYLASSSDDARRAVEIAKMFDKATEREQRRFSPICLGPIGLFLAETTTRPDGTTYRDESLGDVGSMIFAYIDRMAETPSVSIVDGPKQDIRFAILDDFTKTEQVELAQLMIHEFDSAQTRKFIPASFLHTISFCP